ncbi:MAG: 6-bladed beta-propeller [Planctomycetes bacterium]|nr:6-bladed beta-propeller [Planctomycetota bacterium]
MSVGNPFLCRSLALIAGCAVLGLVGGCGTAQKQPSAAAPVYFPSAPEKPRLQFLTSLSGPADLGAPGPSGFEKFVLGEAERKEGIATPYGLALHDGVLYVCDVGKRRIEMLDLRKRSFGYLTEDRRLANPVNIFIEPNGTKYVADPTAGTVFVFDSANALQEILGKDLRINPIDVAVRGDHCYVTDFASNQIIVMDKTTGREIRRLGEAGDGDKQFKLISDLTFGPDGDLYATDKLKAKIFQFDAAGNFQRTIGQRGDNIDELVRPKGIAVDRENRIWVICAGVSIGAAVWSTEVAKIYDQKGRLLLFFGRPGNEPGNMNMPAKVILDYDHVDLFRPYAVKGAKIEFLVFVSNQYGPHKVNVYGFGEFPVAGRPREAAGTPLTENTAAPKPAPGAEPPPTRSPDAQRPSGPEAAMNDAERLQRSREIGGVYKQSMEAYRAGRLEEARAGFVKVVESGLIPPPMEDMLRGYIRDIDARLTHSPGGPR